MRLSSRLISLLRNLFQRPRVERDLDDELRAFVDQLTDEGTRAGLGAPQARRAALIQVQGVDQVKERVRDARAGARIEQVWRDLRYGMRMAARNRGFTLAAVLIVALGVGASTATFSIVDTVVFRPLPYADPDQLVKIWGGSSLEPTDNISLTEFNSIAEQNHVFDRLAADDGMGFSVEYAGIRQAADGAIVMPQWLATLGVQPVIGRDFAPEEMQPGRDGVVILTDAYWRRRFGADPAVVGKTLLVDGTASTVIGVLPPNVLRYDADFLKPLVAAAYPPGDRNLDVFARLRPGVTLAAAQAELQVIGRNLERAYPATNTGRALRAVTLEKYYAVIEPTASRGLVLMLGAVGLVLLIACVNVANLLLARSSVRARECVIRAALGASRGRLVSQLLMENVLLFVTGGLLGCLLAVWSVESIAVLARTEGYVPQRMVIPVDVRVLVFGLTLSLLSGLAFGLGPALRASRVDLNEGLRESSQTASASRRGSRTRRGLIVAELALSLVLLVGFGLLIRSFMGLQSAAAGFVPEGLIETGADTGRDFTFSVRFWQAALDRARSLPGVQSAAVSSRPPVHGGREQRFAIAGRPEVAETNQPVGGDILISADYFRTMGIPLIKGRAFTEKDTHASTPVTIISETLARRYFPNDDPLGQRIRLNERGPLSCCMTAGPIDNVWREIVGVAADVRQANLDDEPASTLYRPYTQIVEHDMFLMVRARSAADAPRLAADLGAHLRAIDPGRREDPGRDWWDARLSTEVISESQSIRSRRFILIVLGSFAVMAVLLAGVGLYGVMAYFVVERRREIAVRVALGATRPVVLRQVLAEATRLVIAGVALGSVAAVFLTRLISALLFGVSATDAPTYVAVAGVLSSVALFASYLPARRATRIDPIVALREP